MFPVHNSDVSCILASVIVHLLKRLGAQKPRETASVCAASNNELNVELIINVLLCRYAKNGKRYLRQAESSAIRFLIIAEAFKRMAASHVHTRLPVLYPEDQLAVSLILGQHTNCFHNSRILSNAVPLGFCSGGFSSTFGYDPTTSAQLAPSHSPPSAGPV